MWARRRAVVAGSVAAAASARGCAGERWELRKRERGSAATRPGTPVAISVRRPPPRIRSPLLPTRRRRSGSGWTASNGVPPNATAESAATRADRRPAGRARPAPTISGTTAVGDTLTAANGTWSGYPAPTFTYQWRACDSGGANCSDLVAETASTHVITIADAGAHDPRRRHRDERLRIGLGNVGTRRRSRATVEPDTAVDLGHDRRPARR